MREFVDEKLPPYVIVSHRWEGDEITYQDLESNGFFRKRGFQKIKESCRIALEADCSWIWLDTCCIDKRNSTELNEAINAMYEWYQKASFCIAYLFDHEYGVNDLSESTWFKRCWTLQELIAPRYVEFYDRKWKNIGSKAQRRDELAAITRIDKQTLSGADPKERSIAQRMSWAAGRKASRIEDEAYSLLGLFGLSMPTLYGSGNRAFQSLQEELLQRNATDDQSIFAWDHQTLEEGQRGHYGLLAKSAAAFASCQSTRNTASSVRSASLVAGGVELDVLTIPYSVGIYLCALDCTSTDRSERDAILLEQLDDKNHYARVISESTAVLSVSLRNLEDHPACKRRTLYVRHIIRHRPLNLVRGFWIKRVELPGYDRESLEQIRMCSRLDGLVDCEEASTFVQLSEKSWGTAGLVYIPIGNSSGRSHLIRWIKVGFDAEFRPVVQLGNKKINNIVTDIRRATAAPPRPRTWEYDNVWNVNWLTREERIRTKTDGDGNVREYNAEEYFQARGYEQLDTNGFEAFTWSIEYLKVRVKISLEDCPALRPSKQLSVCGPGPPWKIWTVDIQKTGHFASQGEYIMGTVVGAGILGAIYHMKTRTKENKQRRIRS